MHTKKMTAAAILALALMLSACSSADAENEINSPEASAQDGQNVEAEETVSNANGENESEQSGATEPTEGERDDQQDSEALEGETVEGEADQAGQAEVEPIDLQAVQPNELGEVMVVMYHGLGEKNSDYVRTPDSFRQDLETYYEMGFRPINLSDYVSGQIDVPAGYTPIVLTFDDGNRSNFNILDQGDQLEIDPNSAIGIMLDFHENHPDWALKGSFFLNGGTPFGQKELVDYKLNWLVENGLEVGNHSYGHEDLAGLEPEGIQKTLGRNIQELEARLEGYTVNTLALPFGKRPKDQQRYDLVTAGVYGGVAYEHKAILLVGWKPEVSVYDSRFDPLAIMRVQSGDGDFQMIHWLEDYRKNPKKRFVSDGNPDVITILAGSEDRLSPERTGDREVITYTLEETSK